jgi:hypothetical protein
MTRPLIADDRFPLGLVHVGYVVDKKATGTNFLRVLRFLRLNIIQPRQLETYSRLIDINNMNCKNGLVITISQI